MFPLFVNTSCIVAGLQNVSLLHQLEVKHAHMTYLGQLNMSGNDLFYSKVGLFNCLSSTPSFLMGTIGSCDILEMP